MKSVLCLTLLSIAISAQPSAPRNRDQEAKPDNQQKTAGQANHPSLPAANRPTDIRNPSSNEKAEQSRKDPGHGWKQAFGPGSLSNWFLVGIAGATAALGLKSLNVIGRQAEAATRAAETAERTLHLTQRADLLIESVSPAGGILPDTQVILCFKNFGTTRASDVRSSFELFVPDTSASTGQGMAPPVVVGAGDTFSVMFPPARQFINAKTLEQIQTGKAAFRFRGEVIYRDVFGFVHHTRCSGSYFAQSGVFAVNENEAD